MGGVGQNRKSNLSASDFLLVNITQMVLNISRKFISVFIVHLFQKLSKNGVSWLFEDAMKSIEPASVSHSKLYVLNTGIRSAFYELPQGGCARVEPFNSKALEISKLSAQKINKSLISGESSQSW